MIRSRLLSLKPLFNRFQRPGSEVARHGRPAQEAGERRLSERRGNVVDRQHREFRLHAVTQAAGLGVYDIDCVSGHIYWSQELKAIAGVADPGAGDFFDPWARVIHPADRERVLGKFRASLLPGGPESFEDEHRLLRPDGTQRWVRIRGQTFFSEEGGRRRPWGSSGAVQDVTAVKEAEERLQESEGRCRAMADAFRRRETELEGLIAGMLESLIEEEPGNSASAPPPATVACRLGAGTWSLSIIDHGSGIGLAACRRIAERLGGRLRIDPESGEITVLGAPETAGGMERP